MKKQRFLSLFLAFTTVLSCFIMTSTAVVTSDDYTAEELNCSKYDIRKYTDPFWEGNIVYNEIVHPIRNEDGTTPLFPLMYSASEIVSVKNYSLNVTYKEGIDYSLVGGKLYIIPGGAIHVSDYTDIHPYTAPPGYGADQWSPYYPHADKYGYEYWTGGSDICSKSIAVTYIHNDTWDAPTQGSQQHNLPKTFEKLKNGDDLTIVVCGDSVASGAMASGFLGMSPFADAYPEMAEKALKEKYNNDGIDVINSAIGGTTSDYSESKINNTIIKYNPDLVILNFGMNDSSYNRVGYSKELFKSNNAKHIEYIRRNLPDCEILLLSSLYGNRYTFPAERYEEHAQALHELAAEYDGVGVADPQKIEKYLIEQTGKDYVCFTADNMVHPGDLGMRLSAQCVIEALSFADISEYRSAAVAKLTKYAEDNNKADSKEQQLADCIAEVEEQLSELDDEWDINDAVESAYDKLDLIINTCVEHEYKDTVVPPTCDEDGYTLSVCVSCGHSYMHTPIANDGAQHIMDSGRVTRSATYKSMGEITYSCAKCSYTNTKTIPALSNAPLLNGQGMVHISNDHNYIDTTIQAYKSGSGYLEVDICPISIEKYSGTPYVGLWISNYKITACYNFRTQQAEIISTAMPYTSGTIYASAPYEWTSNGGDYEYNWKKFAVQVSGNTVKIYIDGDLILQSTNSAFTATNEVALLYTNGELYMDNFKVGSGNYDPATGTGGTVLGSWNFNSQTNYNSFFTSVTQSLSSPSYVTATAKNVTTAQYKHTHSGDLINVVSSTCADGGYSEYSCSMCCTIYNKNNTAPLYDGHTLINETISKNPTATKEGERVFECSTCDMTFTQVIPKDPEAGGDDTGDDDGGDDAVIEGDTNNNGIIDKDDFTAEELDSSKYDIKKYTSPFWEGNIVYNEVIFPIKNQYGEIVPFELMYDASEIVTVKSYNHSTTYVEGVDYELRDGNLIILPGSRIGVMDYGYIHRSSVPSGYSSDEIYPYYPRLDGTGYEYWQENATFSNLSISVTYIHNDFWKGPIPASQQEKLPKTFDRLMNDEGFTIVVVGDSVTGGAHSSGNLGISPRADAYPEMTYKALCDMYSNDNIKFVNSGIGGDGSTYDSNKVESTIIKYNPDLVIINFGMNDSSAYRSTGIPDDVFRSNIRNQIEHIKRRLPDCEILLVSSLYGNRYSFNPVSYEKHAAIYGELASQYDGVAYIDPQSVQKYLIEEIGIDYVSFTADNMVHPGDFGMRITAQSILAALSVTDIPEYRIHSIDKLKAYAAANDHSDSETKKQEIANYISEVEQEMALLDNEWDINELMVEAYKRIDFIIKSCLVHDYKDTVVPPTCDTDGYTVSVCKVCGYEYKHTPVANKGLQHVMDSGRVTKTATYKTPGEIVYSCAKCTYTKVVNVPVLSNAPSVSGQGMMHVNDDHNYIDTTIQAYKNGSGYVEVDICPLSIEKYNGIPYVGLWISGYQITACYNFRTQQVEIINTSLPFTTGTVYASVPYEWTSDGGEFEYNWKKFAVQVSGNTVKIYIDGELILESTNSAYTATNEVALLYTNGELYMDNFKVGSGNYDPTTGTGGTTLGYWDFNSLSNYNNFFSKVGQQYGSPTFIVPNEANVTTAHYKHTHLGNLINTVENGCAYGGYNEYSCTACGHIYNASFTDPLYENGHTLINETITKIPTTTADGERTYECANCDITFTQVIPKGTDIGGDSPEVIVGDVDSNGIVNLDDLTTLSKIANGANITVDKKTADIDVNGLVNLDDVIMLSHIASGNSFE